MPFSAHGVCGLHFSAARATRLTVTAYGATCVVFYPSGVLQSCGTRVTLVFVPRCRRRASVSTVGVQGSAWPWIPEKVSYFLTGAIGARSTAARPNARLPAFFAGPSETLPSCAAHRRNFPAVVPQSARTQSPQKSHVREILQSPGKGSGCRTRATNYHLGHAA